MISLSLRKLRTTQRSIPRPSQHVLCGGTGWNPWIGWACAAAAASFLGLDLTSLIAADKPAVIVTAEDFETPAPATKPATLKPTTAKSATVQPTAAKSTIAKPATAKSPGADVSPETRARWEQMQQEWLNKKADRYAADKATPTSHRTAPANAVSGKTVTPAKAVTAKPRASSEPARLPAAVENPFEDSPTPASTPKSISKYATDLVPSPAAVPGTRPPATRSRLTQTAELPATPTRVSKVPSTDPGKLSSEAKLVPVPVDPPGRLTPRTAPRAGTPNRRFPEIDTSISPELARVLQDVQAQTKPDDSIVPPPARSPAELQKITEIRAVRPVLSENLDRQTPESSPQTFVELGDQPYTPRVMPDTEYHWEPTNAFSNPIYFEDPVLERYGHSYHPLIQAPVSIGKFGVQLVGLPYQVGLHHPQKKLYHLGWYNPGDYVPYRIHQIPWNARAAAHQAALVFGVGALTP